MKKTCENCLNLHTTEEGKEYCNKYDCWINEVVKEIENPSCWEDLPDDYYDAHTCDYENGCCKICGAIQYKSILYCELYGCDPD